VTNICEGLIALMKKIAALAGGLVALFMSAGANVFWH
jgi:hypothetical protein